MMKGIVASLWRFDWIGNDAADNFDMRVFVVFFTHAADCILLVLSCKHLPARLDILRPEAYDAKRYKSAIDTLVIAHDTRGMRYSLPEH